jgi:hypothetical protein
VARMLWELHSLCNRSSLRHSDIQTTMNIYGDVVTDEMRQAGSKVVGLAIDSRVISESVTH